jgi:hypothetical protein
MMQEVNLEYYALFSSLQSESSLITCFISRKAVFNGHIQVYIENSHPVPIQNLMLATEWIDEWFKLIVTGVSPQNELLILVRFNH